MRANKLFLTALALPLAFAACTNEELVEISQPQVEVNKVVGDELVAQGAVVNLVEDVNSRYSGGFDGTDKLGLAWWNNPKSVSKPTITDAQNVTDYKYQSTDGKIYNNLLLQKNMQSGAFEVNGDIYAGAYFVYFPYKALGGVKPLESDYTDFVQKEKYVLSGEGKLWSNGWMENSLHLSHKMLTKEDEMEIDGFNVNIDAQPVSAVNSIAVSTSLGDKGDYDDNLVNLINVEKITITSPAKSFAVKATVNQHNLPVLQPATIVNGEVVKTRLENTVEALKEKIPSKDADKILNIASGSKKNSISTVLGYADKNIADNHFAVLYTFTGTKMTAAQTATIQVVTNVGTFTYNSTAEDQPNYEAVDKLSKALKGQVYNDNGDVWNIDGYNSTLPYITLSLDLNDMVLDTEVSSAAEWVALMPFLAAADEKTATVTLTNDIQFGGKIGDEVQPDFALPEGVKVTVEGGYEITFAGEQEIAQDFVSKVDINVAEDATLNVDTEVVFESANIVNKGTINVEEDAVIKGFEAGKELTNATGVVNCVGEIVENIEIINDNGTIEVTYNKSYINHDDAGIITGVLDGNDAEISKDPVAAIDRMLGLERTSAVNCNQLTLKNFELEFGDKTSPWSDVYCEIGASTFNDINLILENSSLTSATTQMTVKNISATNSPINGKFWVTENLESEGSTLAGEFDVDGDLVVENAVLSGAYDVQLNAILNAVTVNKGSEIDVTGDLTINPVSNITRSTLTANNVTIEGSSKAVTFKGTELEAKGTVTINAAQLKLTRDKEKVGSITTYYPSTILAYGKIENENGGKVTKETDCTTTENYAQILEQEALKEKQTAAQNAVNRMTAKPKNYVELVATLNSYVTVQAYVDAHKLGSANPLPVGEFVGMMQDENITINFGSITENDIKLFEKTLEFSIKFHQ